MLQFVNKAATRWGRSATAAGVVDELQPAFGTGSYDPPADGTDVSRLRAAPESRQSLLSTTGIGSRWNLARDHRVTATLPSPDGNAARDE